MYRYIRSAVSIDNLRAQVAKPIFDNNPEADAEDIFKALVNIDPTADFEANRGGKYVPWIIRQYNKGNLSENQFTNLHDGLKHFAGNPKKYLHSDLGQYKTVEEFLSDVERVGNLPLTEKELAKQKQKAAHHASDNDKQFNCSDGVWECWTPLTHAGSISLAQKGGDKARWCTAYTNDDYYFNMYTKGTRAGKLYIFLNTSDPKEKYQLHFESNSWFDIDDHSLGMDRFYEFISDKPVFSEYFKVEDIGNLKCRAGVIVSITDDNKATQIDIPSNINSISGDVTWPEKVTSIIFPDSWQTLNCPRLAELVYLEYVHLPSSLISIPDACFKGCLLLSKVDMPSALTYIGDNAFWFCEELSNIDIPNTVTKIGDNAFSGTSISDFRFPDSMTQLRSTHILGDLSYINTIDLNNLTRLGFQCFSVDHSNEAEGTINVVGMGNLKQIGSYAFSGSNIGNISLADDVRIGNGAFKGCAYIRGSITLTDSMYLGVDAFDDCSELEVVWARSDEYYEFDNIKKLVCSNACTDLIDANKGYINIETIEGDTYNAEV